MSCSIFGLDDNVVWRDVGASPDANGQLALVLNGVYFTAFTVAQVVGNLVFDFDRQMFDFFSRGGGDQSTHDFDGRAFGSLDQASTITAWAIFVDAAAQRRSNPLAGHFDQPEWTDPKDF
jgi:hypothetical protein